MTSEMENHRLSIDDHNKVFYEMKKRKDGLQTERSSLWRNETLIQQNLASSKEELAKSDQVNPGIFIEEINTCTCLSNHLKPAKKH